MWERNINQLPLTCIPTTAQACALTGNGTSELMLWGKTPAQPMEPCWSGAYSPIAIGDRAPDILQAGGCLVKLSDFGLGSKQRPSIGVCITFGAFLKLNISITSLYLRVFLKILSMSFPSHSSVPPTQVLDKMQKYSLFKILLPYHSDTYNYVFNVFSARRWTMLLISMKEESMSEAKKGFSNSKWISEWFHLSLPFLIPHIHWSFFLLLTTTT